MPYSRSSARCISVVMLLATTWFLSLLAFPQRCQAELIALTGEVKGGGFLESSLYSVDENTGIATLIGLTGAPHLSAIAINPVTGQIYAYENRQKLVTGALHRLDRSTGQATKVAEIDAAITDLAFDSSGNLFGWFTFGEAFPFDSQLLVGIDQLNGDLDAVGKSSDAARQTGLAFDRSGTLYLKSADDGKTGNIRTLDPKNGTVLSKIDSDIGPISTLTIDDKGTAYTVTRRFDSTISQEVRTLDILDLNTGDLTIVDSIRLQTGPNPTDFEPLQITAIASVTAVPELSSVIFFAVCLLGIMTKSYITHRSAGRFRQTA